MALTQAQWYAKLKSFVPNWWFDQYPVGADVFQAMAAVFAGVDQDDNDHFNSTFILRAVSPTLDALGDERGIAALTNESVSSYRSRIQHITSQTDKVDIEAAINDILITPPCMILEAPVDSPYCHRGTFCSRNAFFLGYETNMFLVIIKKQVHDPYSFCSRSVFAARQNFVGTLDLAPELFAKIIAIVNRLKAMGVLYAVVEQAA